jgi:mannose-6-phosphate isomerase
MAIIIKYMSKFRTIIDFKNNIVKSVVPIRRRFKRPPLKVPEKITDVRPWGSFQQFVVDEPCAVKIITVKAGEQLSLQSHTKRSEWWIVIDDGMDVEIDGRRFTLMHGEEVFIPVGTKHRVFGLNSDCRWLEITFGRFIESDIVRYEDKYNRQ